MLIQRYTTLITTLSKDRFPNITQPWKAMRVNTSTVGGCDITLTEKKRITNPSYSLSSMKTNKQTNKRTNHGGKGCTGKSRRRDVGAGTRAAPCVPGVASTTSAKPSRQASHTTTSRTQKLKLKEVEKKTRDRPVRKGQSVAMAAVTQSPRSRLPHPPAPRGAKTFGGRGTGDDNNSKHTQHLSLIHI